MYILYSKYWTLNYDEHGGIANFFYCVSSNLVVEIYNCGDYARKFISGIYVQL
jgi:hypothetical protein